MTKFRIFFAVVIGLIIVMAMFNGVFISKAIQNGENLYYIQVDNFKESEAYVATSYEVDSVTKCLTFKDAFGFKRTVCNNYTITDYNLRK